MGVVDQGVQCVESIGQIGLQHDTGFKIEEFIFIQQLSEQLDGEVKVLVLLHIKVDEGVRAAADSLAVQRAEAILQSLGVAFDIPRVELRTY